MSLTTAQSQAVAASGNVLVMAGAGTGKTRTLVERCLKCLLDDQPPVDLEEVLMVTFTEAAATEMRQRIRLRLEQCAAASPPSCIAREHLALFETAQIGTLHSFCLQLVRQHFYELEVDPQVAVMAQEESRLLEQETLDLLLEAHYNGTNQHSQDIQQLIEVQGRGSDKAIRGLILKLHHYTQTRPDPDRWFKEQLDSLEGTTPSRWDDWLVDAVSAWRQKWLPSLQAAAASNPIAANCAHLLHDFPEAAPTEFRSALSTIAQTAESCPHGKKQAYFNPLKSFFNETRFLCSVCAQPGKPNPLHEDWGWVRTHMATLLKVTQEFGSNFLNSKRELGLLDFHDLEQYSLRLLWDSHAGAPSPVAEAWRTRLKYIFVDEYQDINAAQDKIIECLSRPAANGNRFLVGDLKQSIYRFRLADPYIFHNYSQSWRKGEGSVIPLLENFRSREGILNFVNAVFTALMQPSIGKVIYDADARLVFGNAQERQSLAASDTSHPPVELHLREKEVSSPPSQPSENDESSIDPTLQDLQDADKEARLVALRLIQLHKSGHQVWDEHEKNFRPARWGDMAVLLRSPYKKSENYAKEFARLQVPLTVERGGFYESLEVSDLLNLLRLLDNPLQDIPTLAVLHSPLVGLTVSELAEVRLALKGRFWSALVHWHRSAQSQTSGGASAARPVLSPTAPSPSEPGNANSNGSNAWKSRELFEKVDRFLTRYHRWRRLARQVSLSRCLEAVLAETYYAEWVLTQSRGQQRRANVQRLVYLAQQFDRFQRQSLFRFLRFVEAQQLTESEPEPAGAGAGNSVCLMSIHQSKGLEFPIVVAADLAKNFNQMDLRADIILDEQYGLCPMIKPPNSGRRYPSLPYWLARQRQLRELLGEELRLLYVAMTRARDLLVLVGSATPKELANWSGARPADAAAMLEARRYLDWMALWFGSHAPGLMPSHKYGKTELLRWRLWAESELLSEQPGKPVEDVTADWTSEDAAALTTVQKRLEWDYPWLSATCKPAKTSVTSLRRQAALVDESETNFLFARQFGRQVSPGGGAKRKSRLSGTEIGEAYHLFLQHSSLSAGPSELRQEAERLCREGVLSEAQLRALDLPSLSAFWSSDPGATICAAAEHVRRELPFTARFSPDEVARLCDLPSDPTLQSEMMIVQGAIDLAVIWPEAIWIVDFKSDEVNARSIAEKTRLYAPQLRLYSAALQKIYQRPVTKCWIHFLGPGKTIAIGETQLQFAI